MEMSKSTSQEKIKVVYIAGFGRSGSTLVDTMLGQCDGFHSVGELRLIWEGLSTEGWLCGCGHLLRECPFWTKVLEDAYGGKINDTFIEEMRVLSRKYCTGFQLPRMMLPKTGWLQEPEVKRFLDMTERLYRSIADHSGCSYIVDSSKFPLYAYLLNAAMPSIDLHIVHLIRDARAVGYAWKKRAYMRSDVADKKERMVQIGYFSSSLRWDGYNLVLETFRYRTPGKYVKVKYREFIANPKQSMQRILDMLGEDHRSLSYIDGENVLLDSTHTCHGNQSRMKTGTIRLLLDERWKKEMPLGEKLVVTLLTWPMLLLNRYSISFPMQGTPRATD